MDVSPRKRASISSSLENTKNTYWEISKNVGVNLSSISCIENKETGSVIPTGQGKCGSKEKTTPRNDAYVLR